jgi:hypothetical protein
MYVCMYVYPWINIYIYIHTHTHTRVVCVWIFGEQRQFYILYVMPYLIVALCVILTVHSSLLLLLHHSLYFLITGMLSSRMLKLVIAVAHMAYINLQIAQNCVQKLNQHPVKKACLTLCLTLDGRVCYTEVHLRFNPFIALSHKKTSGVMEKMLLIWEEWICW